MLVGLFMILVRRMRNSFIVSRETIGLLFVLIYFLKLPWYLIVALFLSSTPRVLPHFVHGVFLEKTKQKSVVALESLLLSRAFATTRNY